MESISGDHLESSGSTLHAGRWSFGKVVLLFLWNLSFSSREIAQNLKVGDCINGNDENCFLSFLQDLDLGAPDHASCGLVRRMALCMSWPHVSRGKSGGKMMLVLQALTVLLALIVLHALQKC